MTIINHEQRNRWERTKPGSASGKVGRAGHKSSKDISPEEQRVIEKILKDKRKKLKGNMRKMLLVS